MLFRLAAVFGVLSGALISVPGAIEGFTGETAVTSVVLGVSPALAFPALVGLYLRHCPDRPIAFTANLVGLGLFGGAGFTLNLTLYFLGVPPASPTRIALLASAVVFSIGSVLFGAALIRSGTAPLVPSWVYTLAIPAFALAAPLPDSPLISALHALVGVALIWLSADLVRLRADNRALVMG